MYKTNITSRSYLGEVQIANDKFRSLNFVDPSKTEPPSPPATSNLIKFFNPLLTQWIAESESDESRPTKISWLHLSSHICRFLFTIKRCELLWIHVASLIFTLQQDNIHPDCEFWSFPSLSPRAIGKVRLIDAWYIYDAEPKLAKGTFSQIWDISPYISLRGRLSLYLGPVLLLVTKIFPGAQVVWFGQSNCMKAQEGLPNQILFYWQIWLWHHHTYFNNAMISCCKTY